MPKRPPRSCRVCGAVLIDGECAQHPRQRIEKPETRPTASARGYGHKWRKYREQYFSVPRVCACGCGQRVTLDNGDIDHIVAVTGSSDPLFWKYSNHQPMIHGHHSRKTATQDRVRRGRGIKTSAF